MTPWLPPPGGGNPIFAGGRPAAVASSSLPTNPRLTPGALCCYSLRELMSFNATRANLHNLPRGFRLQQLTHQSGVHGMAAFFSGDLGEVRHTEKGKVADDIEDLVTNKLVVDRSGVSFSIPSGVSTIALSREPPRARFALRSISISVVNPNVRADAISRPNEPFSNT